MNDQTENTSRRVKAYPTVPDDFPIQYVPTWRDKLRDAARYALRMAAFSFVVSGIVVGLRLIGQA
jgi:hypothetical protein